MTFSFVREFLIQAKQTIRQRNLSLDETTVCSGTVGSMWLSSIFKLGRQLRPKTFVKKRAVT